MHPLSLSIITKNGVAPILTKRVTLQNGQAVSDATECKMTNGVANRVSLTLDVLPHVLTQLGYHQAITTGWVKDELTEHHLVARAKFQDQGWDFPVHPQGELRYATRTLESMHQTGPSLLPIDYDYSDECPIESPEELIQKLEAVIPGLSQYAHVVSYSSSSGIHHAETGECLKPAKSFHLFFTMQEGADLVRLRDVMHKRLCLAGLGRVTLSRSGALLERSIIDCAVFSPERLLFEANPVLGEGLVQHRPTPKFNPGQEELDTKTLIPDLAQDEIDAYERWQKSQRKDPALLARIAEIKEIRIAELVRDQGRTLQEARVMVEHRMAGKLFLTDDLWFEGFDHPVTVFQAMMNPIRFDGLTLADPLEPEKGPDKAKFYSNDETNTPMIHTFVRGGGVYNLMEAQLLQGDRGLVPMVASDSTERMTGFEPHGSVTMLTTRYLSDDPALQMLPEEGLIGIKKDMGGGKTQLIKDRKDQLGRVLFVAPRIALAENASARLELTCYNEKGKDSTDLLLSEGLSTTYDSLHKFRDKQIDTLVIDEFEQIVTHTIAETVYNKSWSLSTFMTLLRRVKRVIVLDADLSPNTMAFLTDENALPPLRHFYVDDGTHTLSGQITELTTAQSVKAKMLEHHKQGQGMYIPCQSKDMVKELAIQLVGHEGNIKDFPEDTVMWTLPNGQRLWVLHSNNTASVDAAELIRDPNKCLRGNDILICSPSLGTGFSIDAINGEPLMPVRIICATANAGGASSDVLQHMARLREGHKCDSYLYITDLRQTLPTDPREVVAKGLLAKFFISESKKLNESRFKGLNIHIDHVTGELKISYAPYERFYGYVKSSNHLDRNHFRANVRNRLMLKGYTLVESVEAVDPLIVEKQQAITEERKQNEEDYRLSLPLISDEEQKQIREKTNKTTEEQYLLMKKRIADVFGFEDVEQINEIFSLSDAKQRYRENGLKFLFTDTRSVLLDIQTKTNPNRERWEVNIMAETSEFMWDLAERLGLSRQGDQLVYDDREFTEDHLLSLYNWLKNQDYQPAPSGKSYSRLRAMLGQSTQITDDRRQQLQTVSNVIRACGLGGFVSRQETLEDGTRTRIKRLDTDHLVQLNQDLARARAHSKLPAYQVDYQLPAESHMVKYALDRRLDNIDPKDPVHLEVQDLQSYWQGLLFKELEKQLVGIYSRPAA